MSLRVVHACVHKIASGRWQEQAEEEATAQLGRDGLGRHGMECEVAKLDGMQGMKKEEGSVDRRGGESPQWVAMGRYWERQDGIGKDGIGHDRIASGR